ncbi:DUF7793 family protein [Maribellus maritimus]|uniref:DUF7793 family protein n=1 Tax=Maribellus maritimus TaxID=2870838 RepID=UPI001EEBBA89|nr:hypothetical protein [Maribellus maritimus]MCG6188267.1 hypothetical protein [Maribellus maritimus]
MDHKMWYDTDNDILCLEFTRDYLLEDVDPVINKSIELLEGKPFRQMMIFINKTAKVENRETREKTSQAFVTADIQDVAFVGGSAANRMIAKVMLKTGAIKTQGDFFKDKESATQWLKSKR